MHKLFIFKIFNKLKFLTSQLLGSFLPLEPVLFNFSLKPVKVSFETTNFCNANCVFCGYKYLERPKGIMSMEVFKKAVEDFVDIGGGDLGLNPVVGDPLLDPLILERIRYARSFKEIKHIGFYTNGIALDRFKVRDILLSGVNWIMITFDGFNRDSYKRIFAVDEFERVFHNTIKLASFNNQMSRPVNITLCLRIDRPLKDIVQEPAYKKIASLIDNIQYAYRFDSWSGRIKQKDLSGIMQVKKPLFKSEPCTMFYADGPTILYNGDVTVCGCRDLNADQGLRLGNIMSDSLISLWRSEKLEFLRKNFSKGIIPRMCVDCCHYNKLKFFSALKFRKIAKKNCRLFYESNYYKRNRPVK